MEETMKFVIDILKQIYTDKQQIICSIMKEELNYRYICDLCLYPTSTPLGITIRLKARENVCYIKCSKISFDFNSNIDYNGSIEDFKKAFDTYIKPQFVLNFMNNPTTKYVEEVFSVIQSIYKFTLTIFSDEEIEKSILKNFDESYINKHKNFIKNLRYKQTGENDDSEVNPKYIKKFLEIADLHSKVEIIQFVRQLT